MTTQLLSSGEFCKLRYDTIPVKSASANVSFYSSNSKMPIFELSHSCRKCATCRTCIILQFTLVQEMPVAGQTFSKSSIWRNFCQCWYLQVARFFQLAVDEIPRSLSHSRAQTSTCFELIQRSKTNTTLKIWCYVRRVFECLWGNFLYHSSCCNGYPISFCYFVPYR